MGVGGVITIFATYRAGGIPFLQYDTIKCNFSKNKNSTGILLRNLCVSNFKVDLSIIISYNLNHSFIL
ncbi:hypothetical protein [Caloramator quimbayensis]|uniref:hypothetical protein n=1 Tax=Caloramator quimbayensis TaxID=1147123 RepID=UPI0015C4E3D6|nr:hypothetical protein [Caloramator quimbayensis]